MQWDQVMCFVLTNSQQQTKMKSTFFNFEKFIVFFKKKNMIWNSNAACQAQGFLIYFGALSATLWTTFVAWQASNTGMWWLFFCDINSMLMMIMMLMMMCSESNGDVECSHSRRCAHTSTTKRSSYVWHMIIMIIVTINDDLCCCVDGATLIVLHVAAWVLPLLGAILSVATGHIRYPRDDLGLWSVWYSSSLRLLVLMLSFRCFVDDDQGLAWPWGFFFAPMALLAILTLVGAVLTLVRRSAL